MAFTGLVSSSRISKLTFLPGRPRVLSQACTPSIVSLAAATKPPDSDITTPILNSCWARAGASRATSASMAPMSGASSFGILSSLAAIVGRGGVDQSEQFSPMTTHAPLMPTKAGIQFFGQRTGSPLSRGRADNRNDSAQLF
jgi:hypothetical protein